MAKSKASKKTAKKATAAKKAAKRAAKKPAAASRKTDKRGARKVGRKPAGKPVKTAARKAAKKAAKKGVRKPSRPAAKARRSPTRAARATRKKAAKPTPAARRRTASPGIAAARPAQTRTPQPAKKPNLERDRRTVREEQEMVPSPPSSLDMDRHGSAARSGRIEYEERLRLHTSTGPAMTGGDVDADWEDAETVGDEAPGGDNPTPDQDIVDEIGKAMGIQYDDDEELQGGDELVERDRHRWELDPASKEDGEDE